MITITGTLETATGKPRANINVKFVLASSFGAGTDSYIAGEEAATRTGSDGAFSVDVAVPTTGTAPYDVFIADSKTRALRVNLSASMGTIDLATLLADAGTQEDIDTVTDVVDARLAPAFVTLTDAATVVWDMDGAPLSNAKVTLGGDRTLSIVGAESGAAGILIITQGTGGGHTLALPANSYVIEDGQGVITLSSVEGDIDIISFIFDGTRYFWTYGTGYTAA